MIKHKLLKTILAFVFILTLFSMPIFLFAQSSQLDPHAIEKFANTLGQVKHYYFKNTSDNQLFSDAIRGMLTGLDPHSMYLNEKDFDELMSMTDGSFAGIGIEISKENGLIKVVSPIDDTPAAKAGIEPGDYILSVDNKTLLDSSTSDAAKLLKGKPGTKVKLTLINAKEKKPRIVDITRANIKVQSVKSKLYENNFGYVRISHFQEKTAIQMIAAVEKLAKKSGGRLSGLVLDLRNNPGGLLEPSIDVADAFLDSKKVIRHGKRIVSTKGRITEANAEVYATPGDVLKGAPLIIIINAGSASGSEIVAGALQDYKRALIVGNKSFGKGSVQSVLPVDNKTGIKLTTALYYTPSGRSIQAEGVKPDIVVDQLQLKKDQEEVFFLWKLSEKDLNGFIQNGALHKQKEKIFATSKELAKHDYQLYEALQILKGMHVLRKT